MTRPEYKEVCDYVRTLLVPSGVDVFFEKEKIKHREYLKRFEGTLDTEIADEDGVLKPTKRKTQVEIYSCNDCEIPHLYEMGIPVVELDKSGEKWHVNVMQKLPLNWNRDNVRPAFMRDLRTLVLNNTYDLLNSEDAAKPWVQEATSDKNINSQAMNKFLDLRVGEKRASYDPSDKEANNAFVSTGGVVVTGRMLSKEQWDNAKKFDAIRPSGHICPTAKPYSDDPNANPVNIITEYTDEIKNIVEYSKFLAKELMGFEIRVNIVDTDNNFCAAYGNRSLDFNIKKLGKKWFNQINVKTDSLLIHEFAHEYSSNHLSHEYHEACCSIGAKMVELALKNPEIFKKFRKE